jgi:hypothetical protein
MSEEKFKATVVEVRCPCGINFYVRTAQAVKTRTCSRCMVQYQVKLASYDHVSVFQRAMGQIEFVAVEDTIYSVVTEGQ